MEDLFFISAGKQLFYNNLLVYHQPNSCAQALCKKLQCEIFFWSLEASSVYAARS